MHRVCTMYMYARLFFLLYSMLLPPKAQLSVSGIIHTISSGGTLTNYISNFVSLQVADSRGHTLFQKDDATNGKFAFTTEDYDMFEVCFHSTAVGMYYTCRHMHIMYVYITTSVSMVGLVPMHSILRGHCNSFYTNMWDL